MGFFNFFTSDNEKRHDVRRPTQSIQQIIQNDFKSGDLISVSEFELLKTEYLKNIHLFVAELKSAKYNTDIMNLIHDKYKTVEGYDHLSINKVLQSIISESIKNKYNIAFDDVDWLCNNIYNYTDFDELYIAFSKYVDSNMVYVKDIRNCLRVQLLNYLKTLLSEYFRILYDNDVTKIIGGAPYKKICNRTRIMQFDSLKFHLELLIILKVNNINQFNSWVNNNQLTDIFKKINKMLFGDQYNQLQEILNNKIIIDEYRNELLKIYTFV